MMEVVMSEFQALVVREVPGDPRPTQVATVEHLSDADLPDGDVLVNIDYSCLNYKDGMALTGKNRIIRSFPMVPGVDYAGTVADSASERFAVGDRVILSGWGVGERYWGGYSQRQRTRSEWLVHCPDQMTTLQAMGIGTAG
jgi:acrylyl-CoA reductase (NADPH)